MNKALTRLSALGLVASMAAMPLLASAQTYRQHRQAEKNQWETIGLGAAALGVYGLIKGDRALTIAGLAGAAYSAYRYDADGHYDRYGRYDRYGYDRYGYNSYGYNRSGYDRYGYNRSGDDRYGRRRDHDHDGDDKWNGRGPGNSDWGHSRGQGHAYGRGW